MIFFKSYTGVSMYVADEDEALIPADAPQEPKPALPVECWHTQPFDAEKTHAATLALCRAA